MTSRPLIVYGAGGHGLVVAEAAAAAGWSVMGFLDDREPPTTRIGPWSVLQPAALEAEDVHVVVAVGDNADRRRLCLGLIQRDRLLSSVIHPNSSVSGSAVIARGVFIGAAAVVNAEARLDDGAIVNSAAVVEHHCRVHSYAHVAPGAVLAGGASVLDLATVGAGATVLPNITIGAAAIVGAGAAVVERVGEGQTVAGVPARCIGQDPPTLAGGR